MEYHVPVLLQESIRGLDIHPGGIYVDATYGGGGHSRAILGKLNERGRLIGMDRDADAMNNAIEDNRLRMIRANYSHMQKFLKLEGVQGVNGILADLGVSSRQLDDALRGFSFRFDERLDMRMDRQQPLSAVEVVNQYDEQALQRMFSRYGEVRNARRLARRIADARTGEAIVSTGQLRNIAASVAYGRESQYLARVFQAIRIEVNQELEALQDFLSQAADLLVKGGRLVVISYHSLEDRIVKNFMRYGVFEGEPVRDLYGRFEHVLKVVTRKPVEAGQEEINTNPRARSARLRIAEKL